VSLRNDNLGYQETPSLGALSGSVRAAGRSFGYLLPEVGFELWGIFTSTSQLVLPSERSKPVLVLLAVRHRCAFEGLGFF
jgi:hypothetical protein